MADPNISIRVNAATLARIDDLAAKLQRSRAWVIADMLQNTVDEYEEQVRLIEERLREVESGTVKLIPHADMDAWMQERRTRG
jgi:predicted transcriptional regulator